MDEEWGKKQDSRWWLNIGVERGERIYRIMTGNEELILVDEEWTRIFYKRKLPRLSILHNNWINKWPL